MSSNRRERTAQRKAVLVSRSELERMQIALVIHELRDRVAPAAATRASGRRAGAIAAAVVGVGLPLFGRARLARLLRAGSFALTALRVARHWRSGAR